MKKICLFCLFIFPFVVSVISAVEAPAERTDKTLSPYFWVKPSSSAQGDQAPPAAADPLPLKSTQVEVTVAGVIADVRVTQIYANTGNVALEAIYIFPGSTRAAVHGLSMSIGERHVEAKIKKREEARQIYDGAKSAGKTASLLEQHRPNVFQMSVANILPFDEVKVELRYTELLVPTDGQYEFVFPGVVGPRYSNKPAEGAATDDRWVENPYLRKGTVDPTRFALSVALVAGLPLQEVACRTHLTQVAYQNDREARVSLDPTETNAGNRDFILRYRLAGGAIQSGLMIAEGKDENFFLLMAQPPARPSVAQMPARDFVFIVDVSGSMNGFPLKTAKHLLHDLLTTLRPQDTFNLLLFAGDSQMLAPAPLPATQDNINAAERLLGQQSGSGATELLAALKKALALPRPEVAARTIAVVTDGYIDVEPEAFDLVRSNLGRANLFAFGIGSSVNRHLIEGLARVGQGEPFIVESEAASSECADKFRNYISTPVLTQVAVDFGSWATYDVEPAAIPDVFAQRPVVIFGKWKGPKAGLVRIQGITGQKPYEANLDLANATLLPSADGLAHLWARTRIAELSDLISLRASDERIAQVTTLGLTYNLLTKYTSFVAVDEPVRRVVPTLKTIQQPLPLPQGVENSAVGQNIPTSPEPATVGLIGIAALGVAFLLLRGRKSSETEFS